VGWWAPAAQRRRKNLHGIAAWTWALPSWHHFVLLSGFDTIFSEEAFYLFDDCFFLFKKILLMKT
jgi:hypothetical protein